MCLLGSRWWIIIFRGPKTPKTPFWGLNRHFKPNMRKIQIAISSDLCVRLTWNLTCRWGQQQRLCGWSRMVVKQFQDGGRPPVWKLIYRHISSEKSSDFYEILYTAADLELDERHVIKNKNFQNSRLRTAAILKIFISPYLSEQELSYRKQIARQLRTNTLRAFIGLNITP